MWVSSCPCAVVDTGLRDAGSRDPSESLKYVYVKQKVSSSLERCDFILLARYKIQLKSP